MSKLLLLPLLLPPPLLLPLLLLTLLLMLLLLLLLLLLLEVPLLLLLPLLLALPLDQCLARAAEHEAMAAPVELRRGRQRRLLRPMALAVLVMRHSALGMLAIRLRRHVMLRLVLPSVR